MNTNKTSLLPSQVVNAIKHVVGSNPVGLHEPYFIGNEKKYLNECLDSTFVSSVGKFVDRFENELVSYTGAKYAVAVVNGTAALHVSLLLAGVEQGDEVLIPALTFVATANAVTYCGAQPHFVESNINTLGMDSFTLRKYLNDISEIRNKQCINRKTGCVIRALVPMHTFGHPVDIDELLEIARDFNLVLIEDAAESLGSTVNGQHTGTFGAMGTLSFNGNKTITTGGGGAILTNDLEVAKKAKYLTTTAKEPHRWEYVHNEIGYNYRLPNLNAALGCAQLEQLPSFINAKRRIYERYKEGFAKVTNTKIISEPRNCRSNYWLQTLLLDESIESERNAILTATNNAGFMTRPVWKLINQLKPYQKCQSMKLPIAESLSRRLINLPSSPQIIMKNSA